MKNTKGLISTLIEDKTDLAGHEINRVLTQLKNRQSHWLLDINSKDFTIGHNQSTASQQSNLIMSNVINALVTSEVNSNNRMVMSVTKDNKVELYRWLHDALSEHPLFYSIEYHRDKSPFEDDKMYPIVDFYDILIDIKFPNYSTLDGLVTDLIDRFILDPSNYVYTVSEYKVTNLTLLHAKMDKILSDLEKEHRDRY